MIEKSSSANKMWRESGSNLPFKQWVELHNAAKKQQEQQEQQFINLTGDNIFKDSINQSNLAINDTIDKAKKDLVINSGYKSVPSTNKILGLDKNIFIFSTLLIVGAGIFAIYQNLKKQK